ncbi:hypothetical protein NP493_204g04003 [Ridgeia piscesae]|uniref:Uncharacterized protein n=1 Tax=Ridgeia piscesae TaxID=27915 RepID=A0AAD9P0V4_RIDPI|nr:hypothetical protein NP493_204g04003 [Ridgeia piscesae]
MHFHSDKCEILKITNKLNPTILTGIFMITYYP